MYIVDFGFIPERREGPFVRGVENELIDMGLKVSCIARGSNLQKDNASPKWL